MSLRASATLDQSYRDAAIESRHDTDGDGLDDDCVMFGGAACIDVDAQGEGVCGAPVDGSNRCGTAATPLAFCAAGTHAVLSDPAFDPCSDPAFSNSY